MPVVSGTRLGPYEIVGPLGAGGMGEVYRARDTRLERTLGALGRISLCALLFSIVLETCIGRQIPDTSQD
jgi:serine/threonine protein kinase